MSDESEVLQEPVRLRVGAVCCLNSGGPRMTVIDCREDGSADCAFFDGTQVRMLTVKSAALTAIF